MKWYIAVPTLAVLGTGYWTLLAVFHNLGGSSFTELDAASFAGLGAWVLAALSGMVIQAWR